MFMHLRFFWLVSWHYSWTNQHLKKCVNSVFALKKIFCYSIFSNKFSIFNKISDIQTDYKGTNYQVFFLSPPPPKKTNELHTKFSLSFSSLIILFLELYFTIFNHLILADKQLLDLSAAMNIMYKKNKKINKKSCMKPC